jgi:hypothetical protein
MKTKDQKQLEFLYEQISEDFTTLLDQEKQLAELVSKTAAPKYIKAINSRIRNNGRIDGENLCDLDEYPDFLNSILDVFGSDKKLVEDVYFFIIINIFESLVRIKLIDKEPYIFFRNAEWIVDRYNQEIESIPFTNEERFIDELQFLIENAILVRYKYESSPKTIATAYLQRNDEWIKWRKKKLNSQQTTDRMPELKGIF